MVNKGFKATPCNVDVAGLLFFLVASLVIGTADGFLPVATAGLRVSTNVVDCRLHAFPSGSYHRAHFPLRSNLQDSKSNDTFGDEKISSKATESAQPSLPSSFWDYRDVMTTRTIRRILDQLKDSDFIATKHGEHVKSKSVTHLFQNTPLAKLPDRYKLDFVHSWAGRALERIMQEEQEYLGEWKIDKIVQAASSSLYSEKYTNETSCYYYNATEARHLIRQHIYGGLQQEGAASMTNNRTIVMYSFMDCPWCVAAKQLLQEHYPGIDVLVVELEPLGILGKQVRAELALWTGRTSMPCIIVQGRPIGGFTDGAPYCGPGLQVLHESGRLREDYLRKTMIDTMMMRVQCTRR